MVKNIIVFCILLIIGCRVSRNEYNMVRVPITRFSIKPNINNEVYQLIDTSSVYFLVAINGKDSVQNNAGKLEAIVPFKFSLKFYKDGRVAGFRDFDINETFSLNPGKARQGIYELKNGLFFMEFIAYSPQAGAFLSKERIEVRGDTIFSRNESYEDKYVKKKLPARFLVFQPNW